MILNNCYLILWVLLQILVFFPTHLKLYWVHEESRYKSFAFPGSTWEHKERPCSGRSLRARRELLIDIAVAHTQAGSTAAGFEGDRSSLQAILHRNELNQFLCRSQQEQLWRFLSASVFVLLFTFFSFLFLRTEHFCESLVSLTASTLIPPFSLFQNGVYRKMWSSNSAF